MRIYIAGPMSGHEDYNRPAFAAKAQELEEAGHTVFNPGAIACDESNYRSLLAMDLQWIALHAEAICMLPGWEGSKGARAEHALAFAIGIPILDA